MKYHRVLFSVVVSALVGAFGASGAEPIKIGEVGSMTGSEATFGESTHAGIMLAVKEVNAAGGIHGRPVEILTLDDQGRPEEAAQATTKLITVSKVMAILGEVASTRSLAMAPIAQKHKVPMITPSSTNPQVTAVGDYVFRVCFIDPFQGEVMSKFVLSRPELKKKTVAILQDVKSDYSKGLAEYFKRHFTANGGKILIEQTYTGNDIDFKAQLTSIRDLKPEAPEAVFVPGYYTEVGLIARQARQLRLKSILLGGDGWDSPSLTEVAQDAIVGSFFSNHYSTESGSSVVKDFIDRYKAANKGKVPDGLAAMGYDAAKVLFEAMKKSSPALKAEEIRDNIGKTEKFPGVTGEITIDKDRNAVKPAVVLEVAKGGLFKYVTTIHPT